MCSNIKSEKKESKNSLVITLCNNNYHPLFASPIGLSTEGEGLLILKRIG